jgi:hypothetical protein
LHAPQFYQPSGTDQDQSGVWLEVEKEGNTNDYRPAVEQAQALEEEIRQFLDQVVGPEPENRELLKRILEAY